jgi:zinc protease
VQEQKVESLGADYEDHIDTSLFNIVARVKKANDMDYVRGQILDTVKAFQDKPVEAATLGNVKKHLRYSAALRMNSPDAIASSLAPYIALRRTPETMNRLYEQCAQLTPEDVQKAAAKYLVENSRTTVTLTAGGAK